MLHYFAEACPASDTCTIPAHVKYGGAPRPVTLTKEPAKMQVKYIFIYFLPLDFPHLQLFPFAASDQ